MKVSFEQLKQQLEQVLVKLQFREDKAALCARIFAENSRDGVASHGLNRFPVFVQSVEEGIIDIHAEPQKVSNNGLIENWDGQLAPGMYTATLAMQRAIELAKEQGIGCVTVKNTNHWMRGGTYGWMAADAQTIGICTTNTIANMPAWGGIEPRLGNNPMVIAIPRTGGQHIVLDMAMSQFSYGKLQEYELNKKLLPVAGGYDSNGILTTDASAIYLSKRTLPVGFWKGSGLSMVLDVLVTSLSGGRSVAAISENGKEYGLSQFFLCLNADHISESAIDEIISYTKSHAASSLMNEIRYPGESTYAIRQRSLTEGVEVNDTIWQQILDM